MKKESSSVIESESGFICYSKRRCKKMSCISCRYIRRCYFIENGFDYANKHKLECFVTVNFSRTHVDAEICSGWDDLLYGHNLIWSKFKRNCVKYIRCLSMDTNEFQSYLHPHIHLILSVTEAYRYVDIAKNYSHNFDCKVDDRRGIYDLKGLLGYIYDQNFIKTQLLNPKPPRIKLLTASKGLKCGFPT